MTESGFTVDVDQNPYLPEGGRDVSAIVTVTSAADAAGLSCWFWPSVSKMACRSLAG